MSIIPMDSTHVQQMLQNDAQQLRTVLRWLEDRNSIYSQNLTTTVMTAAGITGADQTATLAFIADFARILQYMQGTLPGVAASVIVDINNVLGVM